MTINVLEVPWSIDETIIVILIVRKPVIQGIGAIILGIVKLDIYPDEDAGSEVTKH